ncbi:hypothetical protein VNO77_28849 [Canavalia gladiata]|uniref:Uncharacterized protein n=1 Tax=Canavalia gladiata TaxID=3824 RepID=A0AAN9KXM2_CANGL
MFTINYGFIDVGIEDVNKKRLQPSDFSYISTAISQIRCEASVYILNSKNVELHRLLYRGLILDLSSLLIFPNIFLICANCKLLDVASKDFYMSHFHLTLASSFYLTSPPYLDLDLHKKCFLERKKELCFRMSATQQAGLSPRDAKHLKHVGFHLPTNRNLPHRTLD